MPNSDKRFIYTRDDGGIDIVVPSLIRSKLWDLV